MPEADSVVISSAVVLYDGIRHQQVSAALALLPGVQVWGGDRTKLVITIESATRGEAGSLLSDIAHLPGVLSANMVFECADAGDGVQT